MLLPQSKVYAEYGIPRAAMRELAERGVVRFVDRQIDQCHTMRFFETEDIERYIAGGSSSDGDSLK